MRFFRGMLGFFLVVVMPVTYKQAYAVDYAPNINWSLSTTFNDYYFGQYHGCGTAVGPFKESGTSPKAIADKLCAVSKQYEDCERSKGFPTHTDDYPSIFHDIAVREDEYYYGYVYYFSCTNTDLIGYSALNGSASKGVLGAGADPHNRGGSCPSERNPINPMNGNKYQHEVIYDGLGVGSGLNFSIAYNSAQGTDQKMLGASWRSFYDRYVVSDIFNAIGLGVIQRQDGKAYGFKNVNGTMVPSSNKTYSLTRLVDSQGVVTGWSFYNDRNGETERYDPSGKLSSIADRAGLQQTLLYDSNGKLIRVTDSFGRSLNFTYDAFSRVSAMSNSAGGIYTYTYGANNNLTAVTFPDGKVKTYHYENAAFKMALTGITDENANRFATWTYDSAGRAISSEHAGGVEKSTLVYYANGPGGTHPTNTVVTDAGTGAVRTYNILSSAILGVLKSTGQTQPAGAGCAASAAALTYDANGNVSSRTDFNGNKATYSYDLNRNLETLRTEGLTSAGAATAATRTIATTWHSTWNLPLLVSEYNAAAATGTPVKTTTTSYDNKGNVTSVTEADPVRNLSRTTTTTYTYSSAVPGLVLSKVVDGPRTDVNDITTYTYYPHDATCTASTAAPIVDPITGISPVNLGCRGQLLSVQNPLGQTTSYDRYNHHGQVEQMTDANGLVTTSTYDLRQRLLSKTVGTELTSLTYDNVGQVTQLTMPDNSSLNYTYDAAHRLTEVQDSLGNKIVYTLDSEGNRITEDTKDPQGNLAKTLSRSYDALNRLKTLTGIE